MNSRQAGRGRGGSLGSREQAQADPYLVLPAGPGTSATTTAGGAVGAGAAGGGGGGGTRGGKRSGEIGAPPSFLEKLCTILSEPRLSEHIRWNQEGDGIVINKPDQLAKAVLPKYYKHSNYQSFVRQLNIYGFHKTRHDEDSCEFKQPNFKRDMPHLVGLIRRKGQGSNNSAAGGRHPESNSNNSDSKVAVDEAKEMMDRVKAELRAVCNRVMHLEAEMGMIKHRHNHLRIECQALLRVFLLDGGQPLVEKTLVALRQLPHVAAEAEMSELLPTRPRPEEGQRLRYQHQSDHERQHRQPGPSPPPSQGASSSTSTSSGLEAMGAVDAALPPAAGLELGLGLGARPAGGWANPPFSASGAAEASVVAAAIASHPPSHAPGRADRRGDARGNDGGPVRPGRGDKAASTATGGFPLAFSPEAVEPRDIGGASRGGDFGGGSVSDSLPTMPPATSLAPSVSSGAHSTSGSGGEGPAGSAGGERARGDGLGGASSSSLLSDHEAREGTSAPPTAADAAAAAAATATLPSLAELSVHWGASEGAAPVSVTPRRGGGEGGGEQVEARYVGVGAWTQERRGDGQEERGGLQRGAGLEEVARNKRKAGGAVD